MPFYRCTTLPDSLDDDRRRRIAQDITRVHCDTTAAPPTFVHVVFAEHDAVPGEAPYAVAGTIRAGRTDEVKAALVAGIRQVTAATLGVDEVLVDVGTTDIPASWAMEGGELLPEPGEEAEWVARHHHVTSATTTA